MIPESFVLQWTFKKKKDISDQYFDHDPNKIPKKMVILHHFFFQVSNTFNIVLISIIGYHKMGRCRFNTRLGCIYLFGDNRQKCLFKTPDFEIIR